MLQRLLAARRVDDRRARVVDQPHSSQRVWPRRVVQGRANHDPRVHGVATDAVRREAAVQLDCEQHVGLLGLRVGLPRIIARGEVWVVPADLAEPLRTRGHVDDARAMRCAQGGQERERELKVPEVAGRKLQFIAASVSNERLGRKGSGVVDEDVQRTPRVEPAGRERGNRLRVEEI